MHARFPPKFPRFKRRVKETLFGGWRPCASWFGVRAPEGVTGRKYFSEFFVASAEGLIFCSNPLFIGGGGEEGAGMREASKEFLSFSSSYSRPLKGEGNSAHIRFPYVHDRTDRNHRKIKKILNSTT